MILVIEDCIDTFYLIKKSLHPMEVDHVDCLVSAREYLHKNGKPDLILIDCQLPDGDGVDFCSELAGNPQYEGIAKIILTARDQVSDKVFGLYSGADDYITKPFAPQELKARCEVRMRNITHDQRQSIGPFQFDNSFQKVKILESSGKEVTLDLTPTEYRIFHFLATHPQEVFSRNDLVRKIWRQNGMSIESRGVDTHMSHLRTKLGVYAKVIVSIYGKGYSFDLENQVKMAS